MPTAELILTSHANPSALELALIALSRQVGAAFRVCVAEDGEAPEVAAIMARRGADFSPGGLRHVSQPYLGFRKNRILNRATASSEADYLVFLDGDCLACPGFVARHLALARPRRFLTGGVVRLSPSATRALGADDVASGRVFSTDWLRAQGLGGLRNLLKSGSLPAVVADLAERLSPVPRTWNGGHVSAWRSDLVAVNGFDESLGCGGEDVDLGFRLNRAGVVGRHVRYSATVLHLHHERPYASPAERAANIAGVRRSRRTVPIRARRGLAES